MGSVLLNAHTSSAEVEWNDGLIYIYTGCLECEDERKEHTTLREFLDALQITAEDCQKAFEEGNTDGEITPMIEGEQKEHVSIIDDIELETMDANDTEALRRCTFDE